jgi:predicted ThiF/HesA family dinucleotide-utilizing enzyme
MKQQFMILLMLVAIAVGAQQPMTEAQKIDYLIDVVRNLKGAVFIRNGSEHTPEEAANHLQMKREKAGARIKTAQDFIDKVASKSSLSGELYMIRFANGKTFPCQMVLSNELKKLAERKQESRR